MALTHKNQQKTIELDNSKKYLKTVKNILTSLSKSSHSVHV